MSPFALHDGEQFLVFCLGQVTLGAGFGSPGLGNSQLKPTLGCRALKRPAKAPSSPFRGRPDVDPRCEIATPETGLRWVPPP